MNLMCLQVNVLARDLQSTCMLLYEIKEINI